MMLRRAVLRQLGKRSRPAAALRAGRPFLGSLAASQPPVIQRSHLHTLRNPEDRPLELPPTGKPPPFTKLLAANRGEIATRIYRAAAELGISTAGIYSQEDRFTQHRYKCDQAFLLDGSKPPVAQYLDVMKIVEICKQSTWCEVPYHRVEQCLTDLFRWCAGCSPWIRFLE